MSNYLRKLSIARINDRAFATRNKKLFDIICQQLREIKFISAIELRYAERAFVNFEINELDRFYYRHSMNSTPRFILTKELTLILNKRSIDMIARRCNVDRDLVIITMIEVILYDEDIEIKDVVLVKDFSTTVQIPF